jgi:hypothetical protein
MSRSLRFFFSACALIFTIHSYLNLLPIAFSSLSMEAASIVSLNNDREPIAGTRKSCDGILSCAHKYCESGLMPSAGILFSSSVGVESCGPHTLNLMRLHYETSPEVVIAAWSNTILFAMTTFLLLFVSNKVLHLLDLFNRLCGFLTIVLLLMPLQFNAAIFPYNQEIQYYLLALIVLCFTVGGWSLKQPKQDDDELSSKK